MNPQAATLAIAKHRNPISSAAGSWAVKISNRKLAQEPRIEQFIRQPNGEWTLKAAAGLSAELNLPSLGIVLQLREVFAKVQFAPTRLRPAT